MKLTKSRPKTEIEQIKDLCKAAGFDFDEQQESVLDSMGNILSVETSNKKLQDLLKDNGFIED